MTTLGTILTVWGMLMCILALCIRRHSASDVVMNKLKQDNDNLNVCLKSAENELREWLAIAGNRDKIITQLKADLNNASADLKKWHEAAAATSKQAMSLADRNAEIMDAARHALTALQFIVKQAPQKADEQSGSKRPWQWDVLPPDTAPAGATPSTEDAKPA